jgi:hypothetical protein
MQINGRCYLHIIIFKFNYILFCKSGLAKSYDKKIWIKWKINIRLKGKDKVSLYV